MSTIEKALQKNKALKKDKVEPTIEEPVAQEPTNTLERAAAESVISDSPTFDNKPTSKSSVPEKAKPKVAVTQPMEPLVASTSETEVKVKSKSEKFIPLTNVQKEGFVSNVGRHTINEEYRAIKRKVLSNAFGPLSKTLNNANIVMVTSPNPNEGKTFTAINLALSIALEQDKTVLLVDADVLRPSVMKTINQPFENGLMEYLLGEVDDLSEVIHHTSLDTLRIIPAGKSHHLSTELLASEKMLDSVSEFAHRYPDRVVIIDSPPLLGINETAILANLAGQAVVVVQEGKTSLTRLSQAVEHLHPDMAKGFVINKAKRSANEGNGYYGYYYGNDD